MLRQPGWLIAVIALVGFGLGALALDSPPARAQSNIAAGYAVDTLGDHSAFFGRIHKLICQESCAVGYTGGRAGRRRPQGAPAALSTTSALPTLAPAPVVVAGGMVPVPQSIFNCSCFGTGLGTRWVGRVQAANFLSASSAASAQCSSYAQNSGTQSPYITPSGGVSLGRNPYPTVNPIGVPGDVAAGFRGTTVFTQTSAAQSGNPRSAGCARCACRRQLSSFASSSGSGADTLLAPEAGDSNPISARCSQKRPEPRSVSAPP